MDASSIAVLHQDDLFYVYGFLTPNNLMALSLTCQEMKEHIYKFCETRQMQSLNFFESTHYLSPREIMLKEKLAKYKSPLFGYKVAKYYNDRVRVSCCDVDFFPHSTNPQYFSKERDDTVAHDVLRLKMVCWLEIKHTFKSVNRGQYRYVMRMKFAENFNWPCHNDNSFVKFKTSLANNKDLPLLQNEATFKSKDWGKIKKYLANGKRFDGFPAGFSFKNHNKKSRWFDLVMDEPIILENDVNEVFSQFLDIENGSWKSGMIWDYIELVPIFDEDDMTMAGHL